MTKTKKWILRMIPVVLVLLVVSTNVFAFNNNTVTDVMNMGATSNSKTAMGTIQSIWGTVLTILQILAVAAIIIAGVRYMFASADSKADIKKQTVTLIIGAVLVFGASFVVQIIIGITSDVANATQG